jgi:hypothetical protein
VKTKTPKKLRKLSLPETGTKQVLKQAVLKALPDRQKSLLTVTTTSHNGKKRTQTFTFIHDLDDGLFVYKLRPRDYNVTFKLKSK